MSICYCGNLVELMQTSQSFILIKLLFTRKEKCAAWEEIVSCVVIPQITQKQFMIDVCAGAVDGGGGDAHSVQLFSASLQRK